MKSLAVNSDDLQKVMIVFKEHKKITKNMSDLIKKKCHEIFLIKD